MKQWIVLCVTIIASLGNSLNATLTVVGNAGTSSAFSYTVPVTAKAYDHATGTLFLGLAGGAGYSLNKISRFDGSTTPVATAIGNNVSNSTIEFLSLSTFLGNTQPNLAFSTRNTNAFSQTNFNVANNVGTLNNSGTLNDATGTPTAGIVGIAGRDFYVYAPVRPSAGNFGATGSGISVSLLTPSTSTTIPTPPPSITTLNASTGAFGNSAYPLDATSTQLRGAGTDPVIFQTGTNSNQVVSLWDEQLQRVYFGFRIATDVNANEVGKAVTVGFTNTSNNAFTALAITPDSAISAAAVNELIVTKQSNQAITIKKLGVLHASTGPSYLIVQGGWGTTSTIGNTVFALPLVDNPTDTLAHGTLANKNSALSPYFTFTQPATAPGDLATSSDTFAIVGATTVPLAPDGNIFDMVVAGDTVYVSIATASNATSDSGLFYSQAQFNQEGKIIGWTPWTKRAFPTSGTTTGVSFFDVDAATGTIWAVDGQTQQIVKTSTWSSLGLPNSLLASLNNTFGGSCKSGSCAVLDLDQSTRGFEGNTTARYALFGGQQQVAFALVSQAVTPTITSPQTVTEDYSLPGTYLVTQLPRCSGTVTSLEYSRRLLTDGASNYFFAGTEHGLFVFADNTGNGFTVSQLHALNAPPFTGRWHKIDAIAGNVVDIKTDGTKLYILTREPDSTTLFKTKVYSTTFTTNINTMFANPTVIAHSMTGSLIDTRLFTALELIEDQLVIATNKGLYRSTTPGGVALATDQVGAGWQIVPGNTSFFNGMAGIDSAVPVTQSTTIWPLSIESQSTLHTYENGSIHQLNGTTNVAPYAFIPLFFISDQQPTDPAFSVLPVVYYFWTDGNRRLMITSSKACKGNALLSLPFATDQWRITSPSQAVIITPIVTPLITMNWIKQIGATGLLMLGTNSGIISLQ